MIKEIDIGEGVWVRLLYDPAGMHTIVESIKDLADPEYQQKEWTKKIKIDLTIWILYLMIH